MITYPTNKLQKVTLFGGCEQNGTPTPDNPIDIVCNNGLLKVDSQGNIYTDGIQEVVTDNLGNTATAERLLAVGDYKDTQEVLNGSVTRNIGIKVLNGTESWQNLTGYMSIAKTDLGTDSTVLPSNSTNIFCTHFQVKTNAFIDGIGPSSSYINFKYDSLFTTLEEWKQYLADQYAQGTPVIVMFPLATPTTEQVTPQPLAGSSATVTAGSIDNLPIESSTIAELKKRYIGNKEVKRVYIGNNLVWENN